MFNPNLHKNKSYDMSRLKKNKEPEPEPVKISWLLSPARR